MAQQVDHYIPLFGRDFLTATAGWTAEERGHYITLLIVQWEQGGIPSGLDRLELVSPGITASWPVLEAKFPVWDDGLRRNARMESHRAKAQELKASRSEAGKRGNETRWDRKPIANASQTDRKPIAKGVAKGIAKASPPSPSPSSSPIGEEIHTHRVREASDDFGHVGWAGEEWERFVAVWNATKRAAQWAPLMAPSGWVDYAASPGWLERARQAVTKLPECRFFEQPLAVTKFFEFVDRILAGEFDNPKGSRGKGGDFKDPPPPKEWDAETKARVDATRRREAARIAAARKLENVT